MMMPAVGMVVMVAVAAVRATLRLEGDLHLHEIRSETAEHILDHMVGANAKNVVSNFRRQMPISQVPSEPHKLMRIFVPDFDDGLHRDSFRQVEKDIFTLICSQANAAAMACVKIESERACRFFLRPMSSGTMNGSALHCHPQYRK